MTNVKISLPGGSLCTLLTVIFVMAKILGYITWSWWLVFAPIWLPFLIVVTIIIVIPAITLLLAFIWVCISEWVDRRKCAKNAKRWH